MLHKTSPLPLYTLVLAVGLAFIPARPATAQTLLKWSGGGGSANWSDPNNWSGTAPENGENLIFSGTTQQNNYNDLSSYTNGSITFSNGGFNISGSEISLVGGVTNLSGINQINFPVKIEVAGKKNWTAASGSELRLAGQVYSPSTPEQDFNGGGVIRLMGGMSLSSNPLLLLTDGVLAIDGCSLDTQGGIRIGTVGTTAQIIVTNSGSLYVGGGSAIRVGETTNGTLTVSSGTIEVSGTGGLRLGQGASGVGTINQNGGNVSSIDKNGGITFCLTANAKGTYNLNGGTLLTTFIAKSKTGTATFNFNGGTLMPYNSTENFMSGLNTASIKTGGMIVDTAPSGIISDITISQVLSGSGPIIKNGSGALMLTGANTHTGTITVNGGTLGLVTARTGSGAITVNDSTELSVLLSASGATLTTSALTLGSSSGCTLDVDMGALNNPTAPIITATSLTTHGTVTLNVAGSALNIGQIKLISYSGSINGSGYSAFTVPTLPPGVEGYLSNNVAGSSIDLVVTSAAGFNWKGNINGDWDFSTANWVDQTTGFNSTYQDSALAVFTDQATRANVNLVGSFNPSAMIINNSTLAYNFTGSGPITSAGLRKKGSGTVTFNLLYPPVFDLIDLEAGKLILQYPGNATISSTLTGAGTLNLGSGGTLTLQTDGSGFSGNTVIQSGIVKVSNGSVFGSTGSLTVSNGATLDGNDQNFGMKPIFVSGSGVGGQGAMIDSTTATAIQSASLNVTMLGDTTFGSNGRWDIRASSGVTGSVGLQGNGYNLTKVGPGTLSIACQNAASYWNMNIGNIDVRQGTIVFAERLNWGNTNKTVTVASGATLSFYNLTITNPAAANVSITNSTFRSDGPLAGTNVFNGPIAQFGATNTFDVIVPLIINGAISGSSVLNKANAGALDLNAVNPFNGTILVSAGTLSGAGSIAGNVIVSGGTLSPGSVLDSSIGTFGIGGNLVATNKLIFKMDRAAAQNSDRLNVTGDITVGGTLTVTNVGVALQGGETFTLFNKAVPGSFANVVLPELPSGLSWVNNLGVDGTLKIAGGSTSPQFGGISISGGNVQLSGSGGTSGATYYIVASPDISAPLATWTAVTTNQFDAGGNFSASIPQDAGQPQLFYTIRLP